MATYNGEAFLREQLDSLLCQTLLPYELVVCDDFSTDSTVDIIKKFSGVAPFNVKLFCNTSNIGFLKNFEKSISLCTGDYIALSDQDDIWENDKLLVLSESIGDALLAHSDSLIIDSSGSVISNSHAIYSRKFLDCNFERYVFGNNVTGCTSIFKTDFIKQILPIPDDFIYHDWWIALHASYHGRIVYVSKPLVRYRQHGDNVAGVSFSRSRGVVAKLGVRDDFNRKRKSQLASLLKYSQFDESHSAVIMDLLRYYDEYFNKHIRIWSFIYHLRSYKYFSDSVSLVVNTLSLLSSLFGRPLFCKLHDIIG